MQRIGLLKQEFFAWCEAIGLAEKLRTMRLARVADGEAFGLLTSNERLETPVKLDLRLIEADQVASPTFDARLAHDTSTASSSMPMAIRSATTSFAIIPAT